MKTIKQSMLALTIVLLSSSVFASGDMSVNFIPFNNDKALVKISNTVPGKFEIKIQNQDNDLVFHKKINSSEDNYTKLYNFSNLNNGTYNFVVSDNNETFKKTIGIENGKIKVVSKEKDEKPYFLYENNNLKFTYLNFDEKPVHLYIYNNSDETVFKTNLGTNFNMVKDLNLSKLDNGSYNVVLASEDHIHSYSFDKR